MDAFFKRIGIGLVCIILSPLWIAYFLIYVVYCIINILIMPIKLLYYFLNNRKYTIKSSYDLEAERRLQESDLPSNNSLQESPNQNINPNQIHININYPFNPNSTQNPQNNNSSFVCNPPINFNALNNQNVPQIDNSSNNSSEDNNGNPS